MLTAPRPDCTLMVEIEHLHYGKLVSGEEGRVPSSEDHGVTRRSRGLHASDDHAVRLPALLDVKRFDNELIDPGVNKRGILLVRTLQPRLKGVPEVVLVRARLRPEDGDGGHSRLHQQAAIWFVEWNDWREHPSGILRAASELRAIPDRIDDPKPRFDVDRLQFPFQRWEGRMPATLSPGLKKILNLLLTADSARSISFGVDDFATEAEFLLTVGEALELLPGNYGRWDEISIASGLRHERDGLYIRYLPSSVQVSGPDVDERMIKQKLDSKSPKLNTPRQPAVVQLTPKPPKTAPAEVAPEMRATAPVATPVSAAPMPDAAAHATMLAASRPAQNGLAAVFAKTLNEYYYRGKDSHSAKEFLRSAAALLEATGAITSQTTFKTGDFGLTQHELAALEAVRVLRQDRASSLPFGALIDLAELFLHLRQDRQWADVAETILTITRRKFAKLYILFPVELALMEKYQDGLEFLRDQLDAREVFERSQRLKAWLVRVGEDGNLEANPAILKQLDRLCQRISMLYGHDRDQDMKLPAEGIHRKYVTTLDAVISPYRWELGARETFLQTFPVLHALVRKELASV